MLFLESYDFSHVRFRLDNKLDLANIAEREQYNLNYFIKSHTSSYDYYLLKDMYNDCLLYTSPSPRD